MIAMNEYLSAAELAQLNILSLPKTPKGISDKAKRECWPSRKRAQRGGGMEYQMAGLPEPIQTAVRERQAEQLLAQSQPAVLPSVAKAKRPVAVRRMEQLGLPIDDYAMGLNDKQRDCAHARMALAAEVLRLHEVTGFGITDAVQFVVRQVESGQLSESLAYLVPVANARANNQRGISVRTLKGWVAAYPEAQDYLQGVEIVGQSYRELLPQHIGNPRTLLVLDPPYVCTQQGNYRKAAYFGMVEFLRLMAMVRPPFVFFSSTRSELPAYLDLVAELRLPGWERFAGSQTLTVSSTINRNSSYDDHLIYKF